MRALLAPCLKPRLQGWACVWRVHYRAECNLTIFLLVKAPSKIWSILGEEEGRGVRAPR